VIFKDALEAFNFRVELLNGELVPTRMTPAHDKLYVRKPVVRLDTN
jgi:hypothetical protein